MVLFPHAKINLGLQVIEKRHDGYHNIISCLYPIGWCDVLEILNNTQLQFTTTGLDIPGPPEDNLCLKAYHLVRDHYDIPPVHIHLHKAVPMGAGLGGGSSDAAYTLKGLQQLFDLPLSGEDLKKLAEKLGSDCAFFIDGKPAMATGRGNRLESMELEIGGTHLVVVVPQVHVSTSQAYGMITPHSPKTGMSELLNLEPSQWQNQLVNDFEEPVFHEFPKIAHIKEKLLSHGAIYASMSGSGSAVYGIFEEVPDFKSWFGEDHLVWIEQLP